MNAIADLSELATRGGVVLLQLTVGATAILIVTGIAVALLWSQSAACRHRVWTLSMVALLALPILMALLPNMGPQWLPQVPAIDASATREPEQTQPLLTARADLDAGFARTSIDDASARNPTARINDRSFTQPTGRVRDTASSTAIAAFDSPDGLPANAKPISASNLAGSDGQSMKFPTEAAATTGIPILNVWSALLGVWLVGVVIKLFMLVRSCMSAFRIAHRAVPVTACELVELKEQIRESTGVSAAAQLLCSSEIRVPLTVGCLRPAILLPTGHGQWPTERSRVVLAHELKSHRKHAAVQGRYGRLSPWPALAAWSRESGPSCILA